MTDIAGLVIDDEARLRDGLAKLLEREGYRVHVSPQGDQGVDDPQRLGLSGRLRRCPLGANDHRQRPRPRPRERPCSRRGPRHIHSVHLDRRLDHGHLLSLPPQQIGQEGILLGGDHPLIQPGPELLRQPPPHPRVVRRAAVAAVEEGRCPPELENVFPDRHVRYSTGSA